MQHCMSIISRTSNFVYVETLMLTYVFFPLLHYIDGGKFLNFFLISLVIIKTALKFFLGVHFREMTFSYWSMLWKNTHTKDYRTFFVLTDTDECLTIQCLHGGTCRNLPGSFLCECPPEWTGKYCENGKMSHDMTKPTNECAPSEDLDEPGRPPSLISLRCALSEKLRTQAFFMRTAKTLIRLSLCRAHSHFVGFVISWLKCFHCVKSVTIF